MAGGAARPGDEGTMHDRELAQLLLKDGKISEAQVAKATALVSATGSELGPILVKMGFIKDHDLAVYLAKVEGVQQVDISKLILPEALVKSIPRDCIEKHLVVPIHKVGNTITLAMTDTEDYDAINEIQFLTGMRVESVLASKESIRKVITEFFYREPVAVAAPAAPAAAPVAAPAPAAPAEEGEVGLDLGGDEADLSDWQLRRALIPLLIDKGIITEEELRRKAVALEASSAEGSRKS